ncbi:hypothetical protein FB45DRAFT_365074 [Roridomyces roridus]|uniref:DUF5648 domain-containing protein n=1 Tax=Roridomyces roridus TaxID=1738132 RepID=A0AAD7FWV6_9AGAR|nr:hypothetical protein FB45DRAFT_365074 [Roridomyces roridus]
MFSVTIIFSTLLWLTVSNALPAKHVQDLQVHAQTHWCSLLTQDQTRNYNGTCGNATDAVPFFAVNGGPMQDYLATTRVGDMQIVIPQGFTFLGLTARVFTTQETSTVPMYMVHLVASNGDISDHIYTIDQGEYQALLEIGWIDQGIQAYVYPTQICGSVPWYAVYNAASTEHFLTTDVATRDSFLAQAGWTDQGIVAYVLPPNCAE